MVDIPIVYSVYSRSKYVQANLKLFEELGITNVYFLVDAAPAVNLENIKCARLVNSFCKKYNSKIFRKKNNFGYYCMLVDFYKQVDQDWLNEYHLLVEDDFLLTKSFFEFHTLIRKNYSNYNSYGSIITFGFNVGDNFSLFEVKPNNMKGCLWGAGFNSKEVKSFFINEIYLKFKDNYMDVNFLKHLSSINKKVLITSHNLLSYKGFEDSRDRERLITCTKFPQLFDSNISLKELNLNIDNTLVNRYLERHNFFVNDCKDCN